MESKNMKNDIDCYLELYSKQINNLIEEASDLYKQLYSKPKKYWSIHKEAYYNILNQIDDIEIESKALLDCKKDCIANL
jgi:hypothetical protein